MPSRSSKRVVLGEEAARRTKDVVRRVEASSQFGAPGPPGAPRMWNPGTVPAVVTTAITQGGATVFGSGEIRIQANDGSDGIIDDPAYPDPVKILNYSMTSGTIPVTKRVMAEWRGGAFYLVTRDC